MSDSEERAKQINLFIDGVKAAVTYTEDDMAAAGEAVCQQIVERTESEGVDCRGRAFKSYSSRPIYIGGKYLPFAQAAGGRRTAIKAGARLTGKLPAKTHGPGALMKSVFFPGGYRQFKSGLGSGKTDLKVSGELLGMRGNRRPFGVVSAKQGECIIDFTDSDELKKAEGLYTRGYEFWGFTEREGEEAWLIGVFQGITDAKLEAANGNA